MDLGTIRESIEEGEIGTAIELYKYLQLVFTNCYQYNDKKTSFYKQARTLDLLSNELLRHTFPTLSHYFNSTVEGGRKSSGRPPKPFTTATGSVSTVGAVPSTPTSSSTSAPIIPPTPAATPPLPSASPVPSTPTKSARKPPIKLENPLPSISGTHSCNQ